MTKEEIPIHKELYHLQFMGIPMTSLLKECDSINISEYQTFLHKLLSFTKNDTIKLGSALLKDILKTNALKDIFRLIDPDSPFKEWLTNYKLGEKKIHKLVDNIIDSSDIKAMHSLCDRLYLNHLITGHHG